jgi:thymidylate synthase
MTQITTADVWYANTISDTMIHGTDLLTRNSLVRRLVCPTIGSFDEFPLVTLRKTAVKMALREWEWFMSGDEKCPEDLMPWWSNQLNPNGLYINGYPKQLRGDFDQVEDLLNSLKKHPFSRRHVLSMWNPKDMSIITETNENPRTPTTCHGTIIQCFVDPAKPGGKPRLSLFTYQRSADVMLGLPHNLVQYWAFMTFLAHQCDYEVGDLKYQLGDAHMYFANGHMKAGNEIVKAADAALISTIKLKLNFSGGTEFKASLFTIEGEVPNPTCLTKPQLVD